jgi:hypothetical protein
MIGEVSWEPKRRRAWDSQYLIPRQLPYDRKDSSKKDSKEFGIL